MSEEVIEYTCPKKAKILPVFSLIIPRRDIRPRNRLPILATTFVLTFW